MSLLLSVSEELLPGLWMAECACSSMQGTEGHRSLSLSIRNCRSSAADAIALCLTTIGLMRRGCDNRLHEREHAEGLQQVIV
jgi:hypothetical protein